MSKTLEPTHDFVVFKVDHVAKIGTLHLPETVSEADRDFRRTSVIAVGPGRLNPDGSRAPMQVQIGDCILIGHDTKYLLSTTITGEKLWIVPESSVVAVVRDAPVFADEHG